MSEKMNQIINTKENTYLVNGEEVKLTGAIIRNYLTRGNDTVTDTEVVMFSNLCKYQKLNPFINEAYLVKFKGSPAQLVVSKEAYMKRAESNEQYDGFRAGVIVKRNNEYLDLEGSFMGPDDVLVGGWAEVYRKDRKYPIIAKVSLSEYMKSPQTVWGKMPSTMIRKVALVQAQREAFPTELGAMYTEDEIPEAQVVEPSDIEKNAKEEIKQKANKETIKFDSSKAVDIEPEIIEEKNFFDEGPEF
jgi:phage recombination protein Bet